MDQYDGRKGHSQDLLADRIQRIRRVLGFAGKRVRAVRQDHEALWLVTTAQAPKMAPELLARAEAFKAKVDLALRLLETGEALLAQAAKQPPAAAMAATGRFDPEQLGNVVREIDALLAGVQGVARAFQTRAMDLAARGGGPSDLATATPPPAAQPAVKAPSGKLGRWLQTLIVAPAVIASPPAPPPKPDPAAAYLRELAAACDTIRQVLEQVAGELVILRVALEGTALPVPRRPWPEVPDALQAAAARAQLDPVQATWVLPVAKRLYMDGEAARRAHMAVTQWTEARTLLDAAAQQRNALRGAAPDRRAQLIASLHPGRLRAAVLPLTHLPASFAGIPVLSKLFPEVG